MQQATCEDQESPVAIWNIVKREREKEPKNSAASALKKSVAKIEYIHIYVILTRTYRFTAAELREQVV